MKLITMFVVMVAVLVVCTPFGLCGNLQPCVAHLEDDPFGDGVMCFCDTSTQQGMWFVPGVVDAAECTALACATRHPDKCGLSNAAPTATGVSITGTATVGQTLTGTYTYADEDDPPDEEGTSTFKWYSGTDAACAGKTEVGTAVTYTVADADKDKYLCFEVTPVAATGEPQGTPVMSEGVPVSAAVAPGYGSSPAPGSTVDFGSANLNASVSKTLSISETGSAELKVTGVELTGTNAADFSVTPATLTIADGGAAQDLTIKCTPSAAGVRTATLTVSHNAAESPATYTLTCTGKLPGDVDGNGKVELADAVLALKIMAGFTISPPQTVNLNADVNGDGKIGMAEVVYILTHLR